MLTVLKTKPSDELFSVDDAKLYLRIDQDLDDDLIKQMIASVSRKIESLIDRKLLTQTWEIYWDQFPMTARNMWWDGTKDMSVSELVSHKRTLDLPFGPMQTTNFKLETFDNSDVAYLMPSTDYVLDNAGPYGRLGLRLGGVWPTTVLRPINGIKVTATFGYGGPDQIPEDIILAAKIWMGAMYEHRGDEVDTKCPNLALSILEPYKMFKVKNRGQ